MLDKEYVQAPDRQRNMSIHEGSQTLVQQPAHQHSNTMVTTEGEYLENISERVLTRAVSLNRQFNPEYQGRSKEACSTDIADENSCNTGATQRTDVRHKC